MLETFIINKSMQTNSKPISDEKKIAKELKRMIRITNKQEDKIDFHKLRDYIFKRKK